MKTTWHRSLAALGLGWFFAGVGLGSATFLTGTLGRGSDLDNVLAAAGLWLFVGVFALAGWALAVLPQTASARTRAWLNHPALTEVVWTLAGVGSFVLIFLPLSGAALFDHPAILLIPAGIGAASGLSYRWLMRKVPPT